MPVPVIENMKHKEAVVDEGKKNEEVRECRPLLGLQLSQTMAIINKEIFLNIHTGNFVTGGGGGGLYHPVC
jgi:hypothetical protein